MGDGEKRGERMQELTESRKEKTMMQTDVQKHGQNRTRGNVERIGKEMRLANTLDGRRYEYTRGRRWRMGGGRVQNDTSKQRPC